LKQDFMFKVALSLTLLLVAYGNAQAIDITQVYHQPEKFFPGKQEKAAIHFTLSEPADVTLKIYDDRDLMVREIKLPGLTAGAHSANWDGTDNSGHRVPAEAYRYVLTARAKSGDHTVHDLSDYTGGQHFKIRDITWDKAGKRFKYSLKRPARVLIRVGLKNDGPLLVTVTNWMPRGAGTHYEAWDGMDVSDVIDLSGHPGMEIEARAYELSKNTVLVGHAEGTSKFVDIKWPKQRREKQKQQKKRMIAAQQQSPETRGDYEANLVLPKGLALTKQGIPVVSGKIPIMLTVDQDKYAIALNRRAEPVFFVDGQLAFENEVGFLPTTWLLNTATLNEGEHYLSVNLRGYEGNFGLATIKVYVQRSEQKAKK